MIRFVQFSDVHLDTAFGALSEQKASLRREELLDTFCRAAEEATAFGAQIALLPGDLFDSAFVSETTAARALRALQEQETVRFFIAPGNHDRMDPRSPYRTLNFPANVHVFTEPVMTSVEIPELSVTVHGIAATEVDTDRHPLEGFAAPEDGNIHIALVHGLVTGADGPDYAPVTKAEIAASGLDYLALGHVHGCSGVHRTGGTSYAYAGCLAGRFFDEPGPKGLLRGTIEKGRVKAEFVQMAKRTVHVCTVDCTGAETAEELTGRVAAGLETAAEPDQVRVLLTGERAETAVVLPEKLPAFFEFQVKDRTHPPVDLGRIAGEQSLPGAFLRALEAKKASPELKALAARMGLRALSGEKPDADVGGERE